MATTMIAAGTTGGRRSNRGRKPADTIPSERKRHLKALAGRRIFRMSVYDLARLADVHPTTVRNWLRRASEYAEAQDRGQLLAAAAG